ncbi:CCA tRNA nucleotidyltransferase [Oricola cellulosilytica]|uniref:CCA tRNA nucleotidyltransferase n=1 Tax=Oricola cellulosilytica TaxID=1429082 RepID=A0A4V2MNZ0_9HYPH|nr:CCA tRNA nucleotidyltransferase [Oricola cellulosilytica]TCD15347.1 CCA tRNA nucleotidyltransferase [Oricola cellulosilytica]
MTAEKIEAEWLRDDALQSILAALGGGGEAARVVGGAVRNHLFGEAIGDVDIATTCLPEESIARCKKAGFRTVPTGVEHGTILVVADHRGFEVTTLREDVETDGRRAKVRFGRDWEHDARRRDFTVNALYCEPDGTIVDLVKGMADVRSRTIRFIGEPEDRIREDYLRILRFFRLFAWYGDGRPDPVGLLACAKLKDGVEGLSAERIWTEMRKLLSAPNPSRALLWMRQSGVLSLVLPESEKWGMDAVPAYVDAETALGWEGDPLLRLMAMIPPREDAVRSVALRWKMSNADRERLVAWADAPTIGPDLDDKTFGEMLYRSGRQPVLDRLRLAVAAARARASNDANMLEQVAGLLRLARHAENWERPTFPVSGRDLIEAGYSEGAALGDALRALEERWIASGFSLTREALLAEVQPTSG